MQLAEKQELVRLLNLYQAELVTANDANIREAKKHPENEVGGGDRQGNEILLGFAVGRR